MAANTRRWKKGRRLVTPPNEHGEMQGQLLYVVPTPDYHGIGSVRVVYPSGSSATWPVHEVMEIS